MNLKNKLRRIRFKDVINPLKWWSFVVGWLFSLFLKRHIIEQYAIRLFECNDCVDAGSCHHCGCSMPQKAWVKNETCSAGNWGPMKSAKEWAEYKETYGLTVKVSYEPRRKK